MGGRLPTATATTVLLEAEGWSIEFRGCPEAAAGLYSLLTGWRARLIDGPPAVPPTARVTFTQRGFRWNSQAAAKPLQWQEKPPQTINGVIYDVHDVLFDWYLQRHSDQLCLHAAAATLGGQTICFPMVGKAGKSVLTAAIAAAGGEVFSDDVVALSAAGEAVAFGISPRLRRPLPNTLGQRLRRFIDQRGGPADQRWLYLNLKAGEIAPYGTHRPIDSFVLLQRSTNPKDAALTEIAAADVLAALISQNFADAVANVAMLDRLHRLVAGANCYRLRYCRPEAAVRALQAGAISAPRNPVGKSPGRLPDIVVAKPARPPGGPMRVRRTNGVVTRATADGSLFLTTADSIHVHRLDALGSAIWQLLMRPQSLEALIDSVHAMFPDVLRSTVAADVRRLVDQLQSNGLVHGISEAQSNSQFG